MIGIFHIHTKYSFDSFLSPDRVVRYALKRGIDVVSITDHETIKGSEVASKVAENTPLTVITGGEYHTELGDIIGLFLSKEIYSRKSELVINEIRNQGGLVLLPHPFKDHKLNPYLLQSCDLIEVFNARTDKRSNLKASDLSQKMNKSFLAGSDAHFFRELSLTSVNFMAKCNNNLNLLKDIIMQSERELHCNYSPSYLGTVSQIIRAYKTRRIDVVFSLFDRLAHKLVRVPKRWVGSLSKSLKD